MKTSLIILLFILIGCGKKANSNKDKKKIQVQSINTTEILELNGSSSYKVAIKIAELQKSRSQTSYLKELDEKFEITCTKTCQIRSIK